MRLLALFAAGGLGTVTRYAIGVWAVTRLGQAWPVGTWLVNVVGCFLIAVVMDVALRVSAFPPTLRLVVATGFLGGLTTYSSFNFETIRLVEDGDVRGALLYFAATTLGCGVAGVLGLLVSRALVAS